jgi:hypothetical protein
MNTAEPFRQTLAQRGIDANRVGERLYIGSYPPRGGALRSAGFDVLVLCAEELQGGQFDGVGVLRCPLDDADLTQVEWDRARSAARRVAMFVQGGGRCLVTCAAGRNRSGLVTALAVHELTGWPGALCVELVRKSRTRADALTNLTFVAALRRLR